MVVGDLHLGYEKALESDGLHIPRFNTASVREGLNRAISDHSPESIVLLGDIKHDFRRPEREVREEVLGVLELLVDTADVAVVRGNHDNFLQNILSDLGLFATDHIDVHGYRLEHGHEDSGARPVIIGHEHPSVRIRGSVHGDVKIPCFLHFEKEGIVVVPPFSPFPLGSDLSPSDPGQFMSPACRAADAESARVYGVTEIGVLDLGALGGIKDLEL
ncbi:MAG: metallophosphoesterase [Thermoplasmatales archaeon]|nr:metallophosphoesterase [Thermoplasmatales archaeon]